MATFRGHFFTGRHLGFEVLEHRKAYVLTFDIDGISSFSSVCGPKFSIFDIALMALNNITGERVPLCDNFRYPVAGKHYPYLLCLLEFS